MPRSAARFSAVSGIESVPYRSNMRRLTNRHPMVVSCNGWSRPNGAAVLPRT
jgi:hypothetical protein